MKHATYVGYDSSLKGKGALIRDFPGNPDLIFAQFDDMAAVQSGVKLGFGWHPFYGTDFKIKEPDNCCSALTALKELREAISDFRGHGMPGFTDRALAYYVLAQADDVLKRELKS